MMPVFMNMNDFYEALGDGVVISDDELTIKSDFVEESQLAMSLEEKFANLWSFLGGPVLMREYRFHLYRRWRADFAHPDSRVLIEIEGGTWSNGRHNRGKGYENDCRKYNAALLCGWVVFRFTGAMIHADEIEQVINFIKSREVAA